MVVKNPKNIRSILAYNLYPAGNWKNVTDIVLSDVPNHQEIIVNVSLDWNLRTIFKIITVYFYLKQYPKITKILFTKNNPELGEVPGFEKIRKKVNLDNYDILTYTHSKGVTKPNNSNIRDWVKMMRYFLIVRHDLCIKSFEGDFALYGAQLNNYRFERPRKHTYKFCDFWYGGTFVSVDLRKLKNQFVSTECIQNYFGVEAFWGNLCEFNRAFSVHNSPYSLYEYPYPESNYKL